MSWPWKFVVGYVATMSTILTLKDIQALYDWYKCLGVDLDVGIEPTDWYELARTEWTLQQSTPIARDHCVKSPQDKSTALPRAAPTPALETSRTHSSAPLSDNLVVAARELARSAQTLDELRACLAKFEGCRLKATAKSLCFYRGAENARLMVIGEAPGRDEDVQGKPFVGRAGRLLNKMLRAIELDENDVHISNIVYWRPPGNRNPTPEEAQICRPFLDRQIELVAPDILLLLGRPAANQLLDTTQGIMNLRGKWHKYSASGRELRAMATLHPAYLLRTPVGKRMAWRDLLTVRAILDALS